MTEPTMDQKRDFIIEKLVDIIDKQHKLITAMAKTVERMVEAGTSNPIFGIKAVDSMNRAVAASTALVTDIKKIWKGPES